MDKRKIILGILAAIIITIITMIVVIVNLIKNQEILDLQKIATIKYFEECMDIKELYLKSENTYTDVNEPQFLEIQLKLALDNYFKENAGAETAPASEIKSMMWNPNNYSVDFVAMYVSGYTYNVVDDSFTKSTENNETPADTDNLMQLVQDKLQGVDKQEIHVNKIEKLEKNRYMVYADLIGYKSDLVNKENQMEFPQEMMPNEADLTNQTKEVVANAFITVEIKDGNLVIAKIETKNAI